VRLVTVVPAARERVWAALVDVDAWSSWNPTLRDADGPLRPGATVRMRLRLGPVWLPMRQQVRVVEPVERLAWRTVTGVPGLLDVDREFVLEDAGTGTRLVQQETASGPGRVVVPLLRRWILAGYEGIAAGLVDRVAADGG
jgi:hypothetical protein